MMDINGFIFFIKLTEIWFCLLVLLIVFLQKVKSIKFFCTKHHCFLQVVDVFAHTILLHGIDYNIDISSNKLLSNHVYF